MATGSSSTAEPNKSRDLLDELEEVERLVSALGRRMHADLEGSGRWMLQAADCIRRALIVERAINGPLARG